MLRRLMALSAAATAFGTTAVVKRADAATDCSGSTCCCLWFKDCAHTCSLRDNGNIICPPNTTVFSWYCCYHDASWRCSECKTGATCTDNTSSIKCSKSVLVGTCSGTNGC